MLELIFGTKTKTRILEELTIAGKAKTRKELVGLTRCGTKGVYEQIDELITLGVVREVKMGWRMLELNPEFPLYQDIKNIALSAIDHKKNLIKNFLQVVDEILGDNYYLGFFTAARRNITPIDYAPEIYVFKILDTEYERGMKKLRVFGRLREIDIQTGSQGLIKTIFLRCKKIPDDVVREEIFDQEIWIASIERGIAECFTPENRYFSRYGCCLALLQNRLEGIIDEKLLLKIAGELGIKDKIVTVMGCFNWFLKKRLFDVEPMATDMKEVKHAINTVVG